MLSSLQSSMPSLGGPRTEQEWHILTVISCIYRPFKDAGVLGMTSYVDIQWAIKGYNATPGILGGCSSRLSFTLVAQSWDQSGCYVTWIITSTTGMDQGPVVRSIHLV